MNTDRQRELYLMLRDDIDNRGREFYDGYCQSCHDGYETHSDSCPYAALLAELGGKEEQDRQAEMRARKAEVAAEDAARLARHRKGATTTSMDAMNLAFKRAYGDFKLDGEE